MLKPWKAGSDVTSLLEKVKEDNHARIVDANVAISFTDSKAFIKNRFNWGKARKFSSQAKLWHPMDKQYDFEIILPADGWHQVLSGVQRAAWLDLHLTRFRPEMVPATAPDEKGKLKPVKDKFGRIEYTDEVKLDEENGLPIWKVDALDLHIFAENAKRYGLWCEDLQDFKEAVVGSEEIAPLAGVIIPNADVTFSPNVIPTEQKNSCDYY